MATRSFYSDRTGKSRPRTSEEIPQAAWAALASLIARRVADHWLAQEFPDHCIDGNGVSGTNGRDLRDTIEGLVPGMPYPLERDEVPDVATVLDLIDFVGQRVAKPIRGSWHEWFKHHELTFDARLGRVEFRRDVNEIFARTGIAYEVSEGMEVRRLGPPEIREILADFAPNTGDAVLDEMLQDARSRFLSRDISVRRLGLEKMWDAFERLKTVEPGAGKKDKVAALLDRVASGRWRELLDVECVALTHVGNKMNIRHHETDVEILPDSAVDYAFTRVVALIHYLLRETGRLH